MRHVPQPRLHSVPTQHRVELTAGHASNIRHRIQFGYSQSNHHLEEVKLAAPPRTPRTDWIRAGLQALAEGGPNAVRVETLAARLGVTKGGFYGYFPSRSALLTEVLDEWEHRSTDDVIVRVEAEGGDPAEKILRAGRLTFADELLPIDLAVRSWARHDTAVASRLCRVDTARIRYLRALFATFVDDVDEIEARSTLALTLAVGQHFTAADHNGKDAVQLAARYLLAPPLV